MGRRLFVVTAIIVTMATTAVVLMASTGVQAPPAATVELVAQAGKYVDAYIEAFAAVVSEEKQTQKLVRADGQVRKVREITSDFLLVKARGSWPEAYRDVIAVDGRPVRNREDRLKKLFIEQPKTAVELAAAIAKESGRYNLGLPREGNSPLLPVIFLTARVAEGVRFQGTAAALRFQEVRRPTVLRRTTNGSSFDLPANGTYEIEPGSGRVLGAEFTADNPDSPYSARFKVRYAIDPKLEISVPVEVSERYWQPAKPKEDVLEVRATYASFRKFQVTTGEEIKK